MSFFTEKKIQFKKAQKPKVSILIPVYNQLHYTLNCLYSLMEECLNFEVEIIVINDNSTDKTKACLEEIEGLTLINNPVNLGFLKNINKGIQAANGEFVLLLNNDVVVLPNLLKELFYVFETKPNVGAVGAMAIHPSGIILEAGSTIFNTGEAFNVGRFSLPDNPHYNYIKKTDYCSGCCLLVKRLFPDGKLVQLDKHFMPAYYEETDLCMQLKHYYNLNIYYQPFARLIHFESISYGKEKNSKKQKLIAVNRDKFKVKWEMQLNEKHFAKPKKYKGYKSLNLKKESILYLEDSLKLLPLDEIYKQNTNGKKVTLLLKTKNHIDAITIKDLQKAGIEVLYPFLTRKGKKSSYLKIFLSIANAYNLVKTKSVFYKILFNLKK